MRVSILILDDALHDEMIRDHIVFGISSTKIREKLINEGSNLTLQKCMDVVRTYEIGKLHVKEIEEGAAAAPIHAVGRQHRRPQDRKMTA